MDISNIRWLGHASFLITDGADAIYIDPWKVPEGLPPASLILITHPHFDHLSADDIARVARPTTVIVGPKAVADQLDRAVQVVEAGRTYTIGNWNVEAVPAYNVGKEFHTHAEGWVGYVIALSDGRRVYHAGDTDATEEVKAVQADIALFPCGGTYTMNAAEAVQAANASKPAVVIPMHWGDIVGTRDDAEAVRQGYAPTIILQPPPDRPRSR